MVLTLKQARNLRGYTQDQMAEKLGIHVQTYRKLENDPDCVTVRQAKIISQILKLDYNDIFFGNDSSLNRINAGRVSPIN